MGALGLRSASDEDLRHPAAVAAVDAILVTAHARARALVEGSREAVLSLAGWLQAGHYLDATEVRASGEWSRVAGAPGAGRHGRHADPSP